MYKIGDFVVYNKNICKIVDIKEKHLNNEDYYIMIPVYDKSLKIDVPTSNKSGSIKSILSKKEVLNLIKRIPEIEPIKKSDKLLEQEYKKLLFTNNHEDLIKIIKTVHLRNQQRKKNKKKLSDKDNYYLNQSEKYLYNEFSIVLELNFEETKSFITKEVAK